MPITSSLKKGLDLPVWEWLRFAPNASAAGFCTCTSEHGTDRYIYYMNSTAAPNSFWRYDTWSDSWQTLAPPNTALSTWGSMRYAAKNGYRCRALGGTSTTVKMPGLMGGVLNGYEIKIIEGTGKGQSRIITNVSDPIIVDNGIATTANALSIFDNLKRWKINQWVGYQCRILYNAGAGQMRNVLYNDALSLTFSDPNFQSIDSWNNTGFSAVTPYAVPVSTTTAPSAYAIEYNVVTVDSPWTVIPDVTSKIVVMSGGIWFASSATSAPFFTLQYYDVARDAWFTKTATATMVNAVFTDGCLEKFVETAGTFDSGTFQTGSSLFSSSAPTAYINDNTKNWSTDRYTNFQCRIESGSGAGQKRRIIAMTGSSLQVEKPWNIIPDTSSVYSIYGDTDKMFLAMGGNSGLMQYHTESDIWSWSDMYYTGIMRNGSMKWHGSSSYEAVSISSIQKVSGSMFSGSVKAGGSGYANGDTFTISQPYSLAKGQVIAVGSSASMSGSVLAFEMLAVGSSYTASLTSSTTNVLGTGTGLIVGVDLVGPSTRIMGTTQCWFKKGDYVAIQGFSDSTWNQTFQILAIDNPSNFDITCSVNGTPAFPISTTTNLVDSDASWSVDELKGKIVYKSLAGAAGTSEGKRIIGNTPNSFSIQSAWAANPTNGTARYVIGDMNAFGRDEQYRHKEENNRGYSSGGTSSMLYDASKIWIYNQWSGSVVRFMAGNGMNNEVTVLNNTENTLSFAVSQSFSPDNSSKYIIRDTFGTSSGVGTTTFLADVSKRWDANKFAGKRCRIIAGTGISQEFLITSNTSASLGFAAITTAPAADSVYTIYGPAPRSTGIQTTWNAGVTDLSKNGKYIYCPVGGGSNRFDRYDITTGVWDYGFYIQPISETLSTGTMYAYDGENKLYFTTNSTGRVFYLDLLTNKVYPVGITPYAQGTAVVGNKMEIITTPDGLTFLVIFRHTGQEIWRTLIY